jgi:hypothetical protein
VGDEEILHYLVPTPEGRLDNGHLNPTFLTSVDVDGLSVLRDTAEDSEFEVTLAELRPRWQDRNRSLEGVMSFKTSLVRHAAENRLCCVYDTGKQNKPNHADLMAPSLEGHPQAVSANQLKKLQKIRIKKIVDKIGPSFTPVSEFRNGRFCQTSKEQNKSK